MHLHRLDIQAFGPFGGHACVDFDQLGESGLFLFTGKTGSGKSSVLDAVCFALYGVVPGTRHAARQLRSDHADPEVAPEVTLQFSVGGRRFRSRRGPAWQRPKRRGSGMTTQQASVVLEEHRDGSWVTLATRLDDAGDLIVRLLGMQASQFTQVAMLPQGDFQKFLGARSDDRQAILQRLFDTDRFAKVERWLRERRLDHARSLATHEGTIRGLLKRVEEASDATLPTAWDDKPFTVLVQQGAITQWCENILADARARLAETTAAAATHEEQARHSLSAHDEAVDLARLQQLGSAARSEIAAAEREADATADRREQIDAHRRAQPVLAVGREHARAAQRHAEARSHAVGLLDAASLSTDLDADGARCRWQSTQRQLHAIEEFLPRQEQLVSATADHQRITRELAGATATLDELEAAVSELPEQRAALADELLSAQLAEQDLPRLADEHNSAQGCLRAATRLVEVQALVEASDREVLAATARHQELREHHQDLREARINAMAGELAAGLAVGCSCPVCGSETHPAPASSHELVSRDDETAARAAVDDAAIALEALRDKARSRAHEATSLAETAQGHDANHWNARVAEAREALDLATGKARRRPALQGRLEAQARLEAELAERHSAARELCTTLRTREESLALSMAALREEAQRVLADLAHDCVEVAHRSLVSEAATLDGVVTALDALDAAHRAERRLAAVVQREAEAAGFPDFEAVASATLGEAEVAALEAQLAAQAEQLASAQATLVRADVVAALQVEAPDLEALAASLSTAQARCERSKAALQFARHVAERLVDLSGQVEEAVTACGPAIDQHHLVAALATLVEGTSTENDLRMRLSAYVLSERLRSVVAAANDQLARMGLDRFTLEQSDTGSGGDRRGGLGLRVRDTWTSSLRETGTLSGGETFMVSLALALGLADTVTAESGGVRVETLFVDEGFGSLDPDALEGVLDTLDALREGGRCIGVVSHVTEMRERIPTQLQVSSSRHGGSTLKVSLGA